MSRRPITQIISEIKKLLEKHKEMSVRSIAKEIRSQWRTIDKALETMKELGFVKERESVNKTGVKERLFSLVKKKN